MKDTRTLFESDERDYYKPLRIHNAFNSNYTKYESEGNRNKSSSIEEYLNKIRPFLSNMILKPMVNGKFN